MTGPDPVVPPRRGVSEGLISGTAWTAIHVVVSVPIAFLVNVVVARSLGVVDYGHLALLTMVLAIATSAASLGVGAALMQFVTKAAELGRDGEVARLISGAQAYNVFVAAPVVALVVALVVDVPVGFLALAIVFGIFAPALLQVGPTLLASQHRSDRAAQLAMVGNLVIQAAVVVTVLVRPTASTVWAVRVAVTGALMLMPFLAVSRSMRRAALRPSRPWSLPRAFWLFALPTGLATLLSQLVTDRVQVFFLQWLGDSVTIGLYALAFGLAAQILAPVQAAVGPLLPAFAALRERGKEPARDGLLQVTKVSAVAAGCVLAAGVPTLAGLVPWIYGAQFAPSADYFVVMACAAGVVVVGSGAYASLMARLRGGRYLQVNVAALAVMAFLALGTIPWLGAWGAVSSMVGGTLARAVLMVLLEARYYRIAAPDLVRAFAPIVLSIGSVVIVWFGTTGLGLGQPALVGLARTGLATALFFVGLRLSGTGLSARDRSRLLAAVPSRARRPIGLGIRFVSAPDSDRMAT